MAGAPTPVQQPGELRVIKNNKRTGLLVSTSFCSAVLSTMLVPAMVSTAHAQDASAEPTTTVVVTGSRIRTKDYKAISPVSTVTSETIALTATTSTEKLLNELPQITPGNTYTSNNAGGEDFSTVDLRGLGPTRNLVLVNGERVPGSSTTGAVDLNTIPAGLIERVEIMTGGASAVYGSDAMSGVVNFVLKKNYQGAEINVSHGTTFEGGHSPETVIDALVGGNFDNGKGNVTAYASYYEREGTFQGDLDYSSRSAAVVGYNDGTNDRTAIVDTAAGYIALRNSGQTVYGTYLSGGSATPAWGTFSSPGNAFDATTLRTNALTMGQFTNVDSDCNPATAGTSPGVGTLSFNSAGKLQPALTGSNCAVPDRAAGSTRYNYAPDNYLVIPGHRFVLNTTANYEISPKMRLNAMLSFVNSETTVQLAPTPATGLTVQMTPAMQALIQTKHPDLWVALQSRANPLGSLAANRRTNELGPRIGVNTNNSFFLSTSLTGELNDSWDYSVTASYGQNRFDNHLYNNAGRTQFVQGLAGCQNMDGSAITGALPGCVALDIFGANTMTDAMVDFLGVDTHSSTTVKESRWSGFVRGDLFNLPAGAVSTVFGLEYRKSSAAQLVDDAQRNGDIYGFNAVQDQIGSIEVTEYYTEVKVPLLKDAPLAESMNVEFGYRVSDYSTVGSVETYKVGADWSPVSWLRFRASHNKAVRAPNVFELFQNGDQGFPSYTDPCNDTPARSSGMATYCASQGVPIAGFGQINSQVQAFAFGNPDLQPETSTSDTFGVVIQPDWFPVGKLRATVDYYDIMIEDAIASRGAQTIINSCYSNFGVGAQATLDCARITRDPATGQVIAVDTSRGNLTYFQTSGTDVSLDWRHNVLGGTLNINYNGNFLSSYDSGGLQLKGTTEGCIGCAIPAYKQILSTTFKHGPMTYYARWVYTPTMKQDYAGGTWEATGALDTPAASYVDATIRWDVNSNLMLQANISNVFDKLPPMTETGVINGQANTDVQVYRIFGRTWQVQAKYRF